MSRIFQNIFFHFQLQTNRTEPICCCILFLRTSKLDSHFNDSKLKSAEWICDWKGLNILLCIQYTYIWIADITLSAWMRIWHECFNTTNTYTHSHMHTTCEIEANFEVLKMGIDKNILNKREKEASKITAICYLIESYLIAWICFTVHFTVFEMVAKSR